MTSGFQEENKGKQLQGENPWESSGAMPMASGHLCAGRRSPPRSCTSPPTVPEVFGDVAKGRNWLP